MLRIMENTELIIEQMKSLRMVHFYNIARDDKYVEAILAYYDRDKVINLCVLDKYYEKLLDKIWHLYEVEKGSHWIILDEYSKKILEGAVKYDISHYDGLTRGFDQIESAQFPHSGYMKDFVVPIIRFVVGQIYSMTAQELMWNPIGKDWFGTGDISAHLGDKKIMFPYRITMISEGHYSIDIGNVLVTGNKLNIGLIFDEKGVEIKIASTKHPIEGSIKYLFAGEELVCIADISMNGKRVFSNTSSLEKNNDSWMLPWEQMIHKTEESVEYSYSCNDSDYSYIISFNEIEANEMIKYTVYNYVISRFKSKKTDTRTQIHFCDMGYRTRGYYKANLAGNYYIEGME